ncbi:MAG: hypothetical protein ACYC8T_24970 [Myxococcaceae bacterium]
MSASSGSLEGDAAPVPPEFQLRQALGTAGRGLVYLNFGGQTLRYGDSSSRQNTSWLLPQGSTATLPALDPQVIGGSRAQVVAGVLANVRADYAAYDVVFTTDRPSGDYTMVVIGGTPDLIGRPATLAGLSPFDQGNPNPNDVALVFSDLLPTVRQLSNCITHEVGHAFGLDHLEPGNDLMFPTIFDARGVFGRGFITGTGVTQDEPKLLFRMFGAPAGSPAPTQPPPAPAVGDRSAFVSQQVPAEVLPGEQFLARVTFKNTGSTPWSAPGGYTLQAPDSTWGGDTLTLDQAVAPGATRAFYFYARAPSSPGAYSFQWSLAQEGVAFGQASAAHSLTVKASGNQIPFGRFESASASGGKGWAYDPDLPGAPIWIDIYVDDAYAGSVKADRARTDLGGQGVQGGYHGFEFGMPALPGTHRVTAFAVDHQGEQAFKIPGDFNVTH